MHPAGASWCEALDMAGNQMERRDDVPRVYVGGGSLQTDPRGPGPQPRSLRAVKGGDGFHGQDQCRASYRKNATRPD